MGNTVRFPCTIVHTGLFPTPLLDPFNPLKVKIVVEVSSDKLSFLASKNQDKVLGSQPTAKITHSSVQLLTANQRRFEVFQRTLVRMALVAAIVFLWTLFIQHYGLSLSLFIALILACFVGPLNFMMNGGLTIKGDLFRFQFISEETEKRFYLDLAPKYGLEFRQALRSASLRFENENESQEEWICEDCGATVDAAAAKCPQCGATFDE